MNIKVKEKVTLRSLGLIPLSFGSLFDYLEGEEGYFEKCEKLIKEIRNKPYGWTVEDENN